MTPRGRSVAAVGALRRDLEDERNELRALVDFDRGEGVFELGRSLDATCGTTK